MIPAVNSTTFEKLAIGEFIAGTITKVEYDLTHKFKAFEAGKEDKIAPAIRFVFDFEGYEWPHRSRWMTFSVNVKSNLYKKYVVKLVNDPKPDKVFDFDIFLGMKIKAIWEDNDDFQNIESIYPDGKKLTIPESKQDEPPAEDDFVSEDEDMSL